MQNPQEIQPASSKIHIANRNLKDLFSKSDITIKVNHELDRDEANIIALGYKPELRREFSFWSVFCVSFSVLGLLPSIASCFDYQQLVVGMSPIPWLLAVFFVTSVALSLAEVASAYPTCMGTSYAVSQLSPPKYAGLLTWLTCCSNWLSQITSAPSVNYSGACMILAVVSFNSNDYSPTNAQIYGLSTALQFVHAFITSMPTRWLSIFNQLSTSSNLVFLAIVFVMIFAGDDRETLYNHTIPKFNSNAKAWSLDNQTDFPMGIAMLESFLGVIWAMSGYDSPFNLAEECSNADSAAPKAIVLTSTLGGLVGWFFMLAISYTAVSVEEIAKDPLNLGQPFVTYLTQIMDRKLVNAATSLTIISSFFMGGSCMLAASRLAYAYGRDGVLPFSRFTKNVNSITQTPVNAVWINFVIGQLLLLLIFAGDTAIGAIFSVGGIASFINFTLPTFLKITYARKTFKKGPWTLGIFSTPIGVISIAFVLVMIPILCFPNVTGKDLTLDEMNWTVVVYFGPMLIWLLWYLVDGRKWYHGATTNLSDEMFSEEDSYENDAGPNEKADRENVNVVDKSVSDI